MSVMTGGEAIYRTLVAAGVDHVFGIVSVHNIPIYDAILQGGGIRTIDVRHEQGALHAADGYARATGKLGVAITSTGPGATNGMTGLFEAGFASSSVLMITGQTETGHYGKGKGVLHEAERQLPMLRQVTRLTESPRHTGDMVPALSRVINDIMTGRPQPGAIEIPVDLQYAQADFDIPKHLAGAPVQHDESRLAAAIELIAGSTKRVIVAGGGVIRAGASDQLRAFAEALDAPVFTSTNGRGAIPEDHPLACGTFLATARDVAADAELVIAIGTRFQGGATGNFSLELGGRLLHIDADPHMIDLNYKADVGVVGDAAAVLDGILSGLNAEPGDRSYRDQALKAAADARSGIRARMGEDFEVVMDTIRETLPASGHIVRDATVPAYVWGNTLVPILNPRTSHHSTSAAIGPGLPIAIGASLGTGEKSVVIQGDGGFMLNLSELATAVQYSVPVIICLFNDRGYGVLRRIQAARFDGRTNGVDLATPDFAAVAAAFGMKSARVANREEFLTAFADAVAHDGPVLLDIDMAGFATMKMGF